MTEKELRKARTLKTLDRLIRELDDYFDDFMDLNASTLEEENYLAGDCASTCRETLAQLRKIKDDCK